MKRSLAFLFASVLLACATPQTKEQTLVNRAIDALGGAERLAALNSVYAKGTLKQWEPEQSDMAGGEARFANDTSWEVWQDRSFRWSKPKAALRIEAPPGRTIIRIASPEIRGPLDRIFVAPTDCQARPCQRVRPSGSPSRAKSANPIFLQKLAAPMLARLTATCSAFAPWAFAKLVQ